MVLYNTLYPTTCLLCGSPDRATLLEFSAPDRYEQAVGVPPEGYSRKWVECLGCGFVYSTYSRDTEIIHSIYSSAYRDANAAWRGGGTEEVFNKVMALPRSEADLRVEWFKGTVAGLRFGGIVQMPRDGRNRLLDIGGATGVFAAKFIDGEWSATIIDPAENGAFIEKHGVRYVCRYYDGDAALGTFDALSMVFVLEHAADPVAFLRMARYNMTPDSLLYIEVPDSICFELKAPDDDIFNACHLWMFSPASLVALLNKCGMQLYALDRIKTARGHLALMAVVGL